MKKYLFIKYVIESLIRKIKIFQVVRANFFFFYYIHLFFFLQLYSIDTKVFSRIDWKFSTRSHWSSSGKKGKKKNNLRETRRDDKIEKKLQRVFSSLIDRLLVVQVSPCGEEELSLFVHRPTHGPSKVSTYNKE